MSHSYNRSPHKANGKCVCETAGQNLRQMEGYVLQAYRYNSLYETKITPELVDSLSEFSSSGWRKTKAEAIAPDHLKGPRFTSHHLYVSLSSLMIFCWITIASKGLAAVCMIVE